MCMLVGEAWQQQNPAETVPVGGAVLAGAVGVNGSWGPWGEERHEGTQSDPDATCTIQDIKKQDKCWQCIIIVVTVNVIECHLQSIVQ